MNTILATTSSFGKGSAKVLKDLQEKAFNVVVNPYGRKLTEEELKELLNQHRPIGLLAGTEPVTDSVLNSAKEYLKVISRVGVGWDNVDRKAAEELGIQVFRTEGVLNQAVAELTLGLMLAALRNILRQDREIRSGKWHKYMGSLLKGKTVGIIGYGTIGQRVGELCHLFGAKIIYCDPYPKEVLYATCVTQDDLILQADIISIHADGAECILRKNELEKCRKEVVLINTARGGMIDETALYSVLQSGQVAYACLDVFEQEPYDGPLAQLENVILTAHIGSYAKEARIIMEERAVENMLAGLGVE